MQTNGIVYLNCIHKNMLDLLSIGDVGIDHFFFATDATIESPNASPRLCFRYGDKIASEHYVHSVAGNAGNVAVGTQRLGLKAALATIIGDDSGGREILHKMKKERVDCRWIHVKPKERTNVSAVLCHDDDRTILVYHAPRYWNHQAFPTAKWYYVTSVGPVSPDFNRLHRRISQTLKDHPSIQLAFNPGTHQLKAGLPLLRGILRQTHLFFVNKEEAELLVSSPRLPVPHLLKELQALGVNTPIITDGKNGSWARDPKGAIYRMGVTNDPVVERTGAGDSFATGVVSATIRGKPLAEALRWGALNSGSVIGQIGPQAGLLKLTRMKKHLKLHKDLVATISL